MIKIFDKLKDIDFRQLMDVYSESNQNDGRMRYPRLCENLQTLYAEMDFYAFLQSFFKEPSAKYFVWVVKNQYVSALRMESYRDGLLLEALETAVAARGKGYAVALINTAITHVCSTGCKRIYSHVAKDNTISLHIHQSCGFRIASDSAAFIDGSLHPESCTVLYEQ